MRGQIVEVQKIQEKMWGAISRMGEELQGLVTKEDDSEFGHEEEGAGLETHQLRWLYPEIPTNSFTLPPQTFSFDATSAQDSVSSIVPKQSAPRC